MQLNNNLVLFFTLQFVARDSALSSSGTLRRRKKASKVRGSGGDTAPPVGETSTQKIAADAADTSDIQLLEEGEEVAVDDDDDGDAFEGDDGADEEEGWEDVPILSSSFDTPVATTRTTPTTTNRRRSSRTSATPASATTTAAVATESGHRGTRGSRMDELSELNRAILLSLQDASSSTSPGSNNVSAQEGSATNGESY